MTPTRTMTTSCRIDPSASVSSGGRSTARVKSRCHALAAECPPRAARLRARLDQLPRPRLQFRDDDRAVLDPGSRVERLELLELDGSAVGELHARIAGVALGQVTQQVALDAINAIDERGCTRPSDVASRLRAALRVGDTAARVDGDEFVVLLDDVGTNKTALIVAERLGESLQAPHETGTDRLIATVSIDVAVSRQGLETAEDGVAVVDAAKRRGGGRCVLYREDLHGRPGLRPRGEPLD